MNVEVPDARFAVDDVGSGDGAGVQRQSRYIICCSPECCRQDLIIGEGVETVFWRDFSFVPHPKFPESYLEIILRAVCQRSLLLLLREQLYLQYNLRAPSVCVYPVCEEYALTVKFLKIFMKSISNL